MARRNRTQPQPEGEQLPEPTHSQDPALDMMSSVRFADEPDLPPTEVVARSASEEGKLRIARMEAMNRAFADRNNESAMVEQIETIARPAKAAALPPLDEEMVLRLRPKIYRIMRSPDRQGAYQIPAGVMRVRTPGVSLVELHPGQIITDRDYDVERLRSECGVIVEDYKVPASA